MFPNEAKNFLTNTNQSLLGEAERVTNATNRAGSIRDLEKQLEQAVADGTLDKGELAALRSQAAELGIGDELEAILTKLEQAAGGAPVDVHEVASDLNTLEKGLRDIARAAIADARPSLEMQLMVQAEQIGAQMLSATMSAYHEVGKNIIGNMKA